MRIIVYGKKLCVQCEYTRKWLAKLGLPFEYIDIEIDQDAAHDARKIIRDNSFNETWPLVVVSNSRRAGKWTGFKIDRLKGIRETGDY
jgi:glutaredoxin